MATAAPAPALTLDIDRTGDVVTIKCHGKLISGVTDVLYSAVCRNLNGAKHMVLDLGDLPPEQTRRIPLATWYRFRLHAEKSRTLFLLITCAQGCEQSCAESRVQAAGMRRIAHSLLPSGSRR